MPLDQVDVDQLPTGKEMSFLEHLEELRWHIMRSVLAILVLSIVVFFFKDFVFNVVIFGPRKTDFFTYRLLCKLPGLCFYPPPFELITRDLGEKFITHTKVSLLLGLLLAFPFMLWELWKFIKPGLYTHEQKAASGFVIICSLLFLSGNLFGYYFMMPFCINFLVGYQLGDVVAAPTLVSYVNYLIMFTLPIGLVFELPVLIFFLAKIGLVTADFMRTYRKHIFIVILIVAAIITPPDVVSQIIITIPLYMLFEVSILIAQRIENRKPKEIE